MQKVKYVLKTDEPEIVSVKYWLEITPDQQAVTLMGQHNMFVPQKIITVLQHNGFSRHALNSEFAKQAHIPVDRKGLIEFSMNL